MIDIIKQNHPRVFILRFREGRSVGRCTLDWIDVLIQASVEHQYGCGPATFVRTRRAHRRSEHLDTHGQARGTLPCGLLEHWQPTNQLR